MKPQALIFGLFISLATVVCGRAAPASRDNPYGEWAMKPLGPQPGTFTKTLRLANAARNIAGNLSNQTIFIKVLNMDDNQP
jgi:hypothetical protein